MKNKKVEKVAVIYNRESPKKLDETVGITDEDTWDSARLVAQTSKKLGYKTRLIEVLPDRVSRVGRIRDEIVFNMCEWSGKDSWLGVEVIEGLERRRKPFTGGNSESYRWGSDKIEMKMLFEKYGIPTPKWGVFSDGKLRLSKKINFPVVLKLAFEHCSVGLDEKSLVTGPEFLEKRASELEKRYGEPILIEEFIGGNEYQIFVLEKEGKPWVLPPVETVYKRQGGKVPLITFADNWLSKDAGEKVESIRVAESGLPLIIQMVEMAKGAWEKLDCRGYVRFDVRTEREQPFFLEVNINPGIGWDEDEDMRVAAEGAQLDLAGVVSLILESSVFHHR